ncbi:hypothetical protein DER45DRAFT_632007 [Fusarium avenaceum]|nr:hypothetical protein DER45DRAFT_632007 [Fusarium avenaceum]
MERNTPEPQCDSEATTASPMESNYSTNAIPDYEYLTRLTPITGSQARRGRLDPERVFGDESYQFIHEGSGYRRFADPSLLPTDNLREILKRYLPRSVAYTKYDIRNRTDEYFSNEPPEQISPFVDRLARFLVAFLGGAMLAHDVDQPAREALRLRRTFDASHSVVLGEKILNTLKRTSVPFCKAEVAVE